MSFDRNPIQDIGVPDVRAVLICLLLLTVALGVATTGCGGPQEEQNQDAAAGRPGGDIALPRGTSPSALAVDEGGTLWIAESSADAIAEYRPNGRIIQHRLGEATDTSVSELAFGPNDTLWFQGFEILGWLARDGTVSGYQTGSGPDIGLPDSLTRGPDGEIWFTSSGATVRRILADGTIRVYPVQREGSQVSLSALTTGPDGALWFIETNIGRDDAEAISRLEPEGSYSRWLLPEPHRSPVDLVAGPDSSMWFTEQSGYSIGRITLDGRIREFPLKPGTTPYGITPGSDDALWFTAQHQIGRITTAGALTTWPLKGAKTPGAIVEDPHGGFWVTDSEADTVRHFAPPD